MTKKRPCRQIFTLKISRTSGLSQDNFRVFQDLSRILPEVGTNFKNFDHLAAGCQPVSWVITKFFRITQIGKLKNNLTRGDFPVEFQDYVQTLCIIIINILFTISIYLAYYTASLR